MLIDVAAFVLTTSLCSLKDASSRSPLWGAFIADEWRYAAPHAVLWASCQGLIAFSQPVWNSSTHASQCVCTHCISSVHTSCCLYLVATNAHTDTQAEEVNEFKVMHPKCKAAFCWTGILSCEQSFSFIVTNPALSFCEDSMFLTMTLQSESACSEMWAVDLAAFLYCRGQWKDRTIIHRLSANTASQKCNYVLMCWCCERCF